MIKYTGIVIIALYIPPSNSTYYKDNYFDTLNMLIGNYVPFKTVYILGDLNSRYGNFTNHPSLKYKPNPDGSVNTNGRKLRKILENNKNITLLNGPIHPNRPFDSKFTFFRGYNASQNDVCLTNNTVDTCELKILDKLPLSDHCPVVINFKGNSNCSTDLLNNAR